MSTKLKKTISIAVVILIIISSVLFLYGYFGSRSNDGTIVENIVNIFPGTNTVRDNVPTNNQEGEGTNTDNTTPSDNPALDEFASRLTQISNTPVSGSFYTDDSIRYIDTATGNIFEYNESLGQATKITNTTVPKIYDSYWINKDTFVARYLGTGNTIKSFIGLIENAGQNGRINTEFLPDDITTISINSNGEIFYAYSGGRGYEGVIRPGSLNATGEIIFELPVSELTFFWHNIEGTPRLYAYNNPSYSLPGTLFEVSRSGNFTQIIDGVLGLTATSLGDQIYTSQQGSALSVLDSNNNLTALGVPALAEKCIQTKENLYCSFDQNQTSTLPDNWYLGIVSFNDLFYKTNTDRAPEVVYSFEAISGGVDMVNLATSPDGKYIIFTNKKDGSLWRLEL